MIRIILLLAALLLPSAVRADDRRPLPVPSTGGVCPSGYSPSPNVRLLRAASEHALQCRAEAGSRAMPDRHA